MTARSIRSGLGRLATMFSVATLAIASPVYLRLLESPGLAPLLRLALLVQILPAIALWLVDLALLRLAPVAVWRAWRGVLYLIVVMSFGRQAQVSLKLQGEVGGVAEPVVMAFALLAGVTVVVLAFRALGLYLAAFALPLAAWTLYVSAMLGSFNPPRTARVAAASGPPLFVLIFDGLDREVFSHDGRVRKDWPALRRLADMSVSYTDATTNYGNTCPSVATLLTGRLLPSLPPLTGRCLEAVPNLGSSNVLSDLAREREVRVYGQSLRYCFDAAFRCRGTAYLQARRPWLPLLQHWLPNGIRTATGVDRVLGYSEHTYTLMVFERFLADITAAGAPGTVFYLHILLPHEPYIFDETGGIHAPSYPGRWRDEREYAAVLRDYTRQARFVDRLVGRFLARLDAEGLTDRSVIALTSDHGIWPFAAFAPPRFVGEFEINSSRPRVALMLHAPGLAPGLTAADYQHVDFRRLLLALLRGNGAPLVERPAHGRVPGEKLFCSHGVWYVRRDGARWAPRGGAGGGGACRGPA